MGGGAEAMTLPEASFFLSGAHKFEAEVTPSGYGSRIAIDGVDVPDVRSFKISERICWVVISIIVFSDTFLTRPAPF